VCCGGIVVKPGDILVGDADGIVVIDPQDAPNILEKAREKYKQEQIKFKSIEEGTMDRSWVDKTLVKLGCDFV